MVTEGVQAARACGVTLQVEEELERVRLVAQQTASGSLVAIGHRQHKFDALRFSERGANRNRVH